MADRNIEEQDLRIELMTTQIDKNRLDMVRVRQEMRWQPWVALATLLAAVAAVSGVILGLAHFLR